MLIPYSTDAPIYHWPLATVGLVLTNVLVFVGLSATESQDPSVRYDAAEVEFAEQSVGDEYLADEDPATELAVDDYPVDEWTYDETTASESIVDQYILVYGDGLHPVQWFSSMFLHADILHLLGNMFFLWGFGLVVEGKLGWWKFLVTLIKQLIAKKNWSAVVPLMLDHVRRFPQKSLRMRLNVAQLLIQHERRPARALELLAEIPAGSLPEEAESIRRRLVAKARQMQAEGELELEGDDV